jgi:hypothetical protein
LNFQQENDRQAPAVQAEDGPASSLARQKDA